MNGNPRATCPYCEATLDGFTFAGQGEKVFAKEGDLSICYYCRGPLVFCADLTLRRPTSAELELFTRAAHAKANRAIAERQKALASIVDRVKHSQ